MIELLAGLSAILAVLLIVAAVFAITYRDERDEARADLETALGAQEILENRITVLKGDNEALLNTNKNLSRDLDDARRDIGRLKAEAVAKKPKRGPGGKFVAKKPKPVACG